MTALTDEGRWREKSQREVQPFISGEKPSIVEPYQLTSLAGHAALFDLGHTAGARTAADLILAVEPVDTVRFARGWTDDMFMATSLLARVASLSYDGRYARAIARRLITYVDKLQRADGLFIHAVDGPHAWGRGNGFAALGLVEALTHLPARWSERPRVLEIYRRHMRALAKHQSDDGEPHAQKGIDFSSSPRQRS